jgi:hypothetical protein
MRRLLPALLAAAPAAAQENAIKQDSVLVSGPALIDNPRGESGLSLVREFELYIDFEREAGEARYGLVIELDTEESEDEVGRIVDEAFLFYENDWGRLEIGEADGAGDETLFTPSGCLFTCPGDGDGLLYDIYEFDDAGVPLGINNEGEDSGDALKVTYYTPEWNPGRLRGLRAGLSYAPSSVTDLRGGALADGWRFWEVAAEGGVDLAPLTGGEGDVARLSAAFFDSEVTKASWAGAAAAAIGPWGASLRYAYQSVQLDLDDDRDGAFERKVETDEHSLSLSGGYDAGWWFTGVTGVTALTSDVREPGDLSLGAEAALRLAPGVIAAVVLERADLPRGGRAGAAALLLAVDF